MTGPAATTLAAIEDLLASVCAAERTEDFIAGRGMASPSVRTPGGTRIEGLDQPAISSLEVRPWDGEAVGVVEVEIAPDAAPTWGEVRVRLGPFEELPRLHPGPAALAAEWWRPHLPVDATLLVIDPGSPDVPLTHLNIRRGRSHP